MKGKLVVLVLFFMSICGYSQQETLLFSEALTRYLPKYEERANKAYRTHNIERAEFLFDSLVNHCLKGSYLDNFRVHDLKKKEIFLQDLEKPVFLRTYASWLVPTEGEIPALNQLAEEYQEDVQIVVLFWDNRATVKKLSRKYHKNIKVLYVDELQNKSPGIISTLKHSLGFPTTFLLNRDKRIVDIRRSLSHPFGISAEESFEMNYKSIGDSISLLLLNDSDKLDPNVGLVQLP